MADLSNKDLELLSWATDGLTVDEIAAKMKCSPNTIKSRKSRIFTKLGARNMAEATYRAVHEIARWRRENGRPDETIDSTLGFRANIGG